MRSMLLTTDGDTRLVSRPLHTGKSREEYLTARTAVIPHVMRNIETDYGRGVLLSSM